MGVVVDSAGDIYIADFTNSRVRKVASDGTITTVASGSQVAIGGQWPTTSAFVNAPSGVAADSAGNLYIADTGNNRIRKVSNGIITTAALSSASGRLCTQKKTGSEPPFSLPV